MFTASQKRKENIAEYLLYMWHIEDAIRANGMDIERIKKSLVDTRKDLNDEQKKQLVEWYESLIDMMRSEDVVNFGHLQMNKNILSQLVALHNALLKDPRFPEYTKEFYATLPIIVELRAKSGEDKKGEIETCFNALYGMLMLRLAGKEISHETAEAIKQISKFIAVIAHYFKRDEEDDLFKNDESTASI